MPLKGFIVAPKILFYRDFCRDMYFTSTEYGHIYTLHSLQGLPQHHRLPIFLVAYSFYETSMDWDRMLGSPYYKDFLDEASLVLRPMPGSKWY